MLRTFLACDQAGQRLDILQHKKQVVFKSLRKIKLISYTFSSREPIDTQAYLEIQTGNVVYYNGFYVIMG